MTFLRAKRSRRSGHPRSPVSRASFDAEEIAAEVGRYIEAVAELVGEGEP